MRIVTATGGIAGTNCFLIADEKSGTAVLFDALRWEQTSGMRAASAVPIARASPTAASR